MGHHSRILSSPCPLASQCDAMRMTKGDKDHLCPNDKSRLRYQFRNGRDTWLVCLHCPFEIRELDSECPTHHALHVIYEGVALCPRCMLSRYSVRVFGAVH